MVKQAHNRVRPIAAHESRSGLQPLTSLSKGLELLVRLRDSKEALSLTEISLASGLNKVTVLRLLVTLEKFRFVEKDPQSKKYRIGSNAFYVGTGFIAEGIQKKTFEIMKRLVEGLKHTITLSVLDGASVLFVERVDGTERVKVTVDTGSRVPVYSSAAGKALLAGLSDSEIVSRLKQTRLTRATDSMSASVESVMAAIAKVRSCGFAVNNEESTPGLHAIAVPVKDPAGESIAALGAAFPAGFLKTKEQQQKVARTLQLAAREIGRLGPVIRR
jgi:DNA-binding IclR family transcriptional regulator